MHYGIFFEEFYRFQGRKLNLNICHMKKNVLVITIVLGFMAWSCSKIETSNQKFTLKQSVESNVDRINTALDRIAETKGYQLLNSGEVAKSDYSFSDSITLNQVSGIYEYQPVPFMHNHYILIPYRLFKKTETSDNMIVKLPQKLVFHPGYLHNFSPADSVLKNNFTITATDYHLYYSPFNGYDYKLSAGFVLDSTDIGSLNMMNSSGSTGRSFSADYTFTGGYKINVNSQSGDTSISEFALSDNDQTLLKEKVVFTGTGYKKHERQYILSIGNVDIKRGAGIDSIQVYLDGVLQKTAGVKITDSSDTTGTICNKRDIKLTFDDGTTTNLSTLIDPALATLRTMVNSLGNMYIAKNILDYIAINIYLINT